MIQYAKDKVTLNNLQFIDCFNKKSDFCNIYFTSVIKTNIIMIELLNLRVGLYIPVAGCNY